MFGGFTTTPWAVNVTALGPEYYGTGESFLYKLKGGSSTQIQQEEEPRQRNQNQQQRKGLTAAGKAVLGGIQVFPWSRENNYCMLSTERSVAMGGGGGEYGLYVGENFEAGVSGACETFGNPQLSKGKHFEVLDLEWCVGAI